MVKNGCTKTLSRHTLFGFATLTRVASALLVVVLGGLTAAESHAQLTVTGGTEVVSQYVWRGYVLVDGATVQPFLDVDWEDTGLTLSLWGSATGTQRGDYQNFEPHELCH